MKKCTKDRSIKSSMKRITQRDAVYLGQCQLKRLPACCAVVAGMVFPKDT